jgi:hypothetical protein
MMEMKVEMRPDLNNNLFMAYVVYTNGLEIVVDKALADSHEGGPKAFVAWEVAAAKREAKFLEEK